MSTRPSTGAKAKAKSKSIARAHEHTGIVVRPMTTADVPEGRRITHIAFGTRFGVKDLDTFWADHDSIGSRCGAEHIASFVAEVDGTLAGISIVTHWGSVGAFGPVAVLPEVQDRHVGTALVAAVSDQMRAWDLTHAGLCTFPDSPKHIGLYGKFGFHPRFLTPLMAAPARAAGDQGRWSRYSQLSVGERQAALAACRELAEALYPGLDFGAEVRNVAARKLGDTLLLWEGRDRLAGFAVCQWGPMTEADTGQCFVKFGAVRPGAGDAERFDALLDAWGSLAASVDLPTLSAGVNLAHEGAYQHLLARGFRAQANVVTMHRPNKPGYSRPDTYILDDWR